MLSPDEFRQLKRVIQSPLYGGNAHSEKLYAALYPKYPDFNLSPTDFRKINSKIFPDKDFNSKRLQKIFTDLLEITEAYLLKLHLNKNDFLNEKITTLTTLERTSVFDLFQKSQQKLHEFLEEEEIKNEAYWSEKMELYEHLYRNPQHNKYNPNDAILDQLNSAINHHFAYLKMRHILLLDSDVTSSAHPYLKELEKALEEGLFQEDNLLQLYKLSTVKIKP